MLSDEIFRPLAFDAPSWSVFNLFNLLVAATFAATLVAIGRWSPGALARPALLVAFFLLLIFEIPLALFSPVLERSLPSPWFFALSLHFPVLVALTWTFLTPIITTSMFPCLTVPSTSHASGLSESNWIILLVLFIVLSAAYLVRIGFSCTGLYAILVDPELSLLARETSIKLVGTSLATIAYGVLANVLSPILVYFAVRNTHLQLSQRDFLGGILWVGIGMVALLVVLLPGIKGNLLAPLIVVGVGVLLNRGTWLGRGFSIALLLGICLLLLSTLEAVSERRLVKFGAFYNFGQCAKDLQACVEARALIESLLAREDSLRFSNKRLKHLDVEVTCACSVSIDPLFAAQHCSVKRPPPASGLLRDVPTLSQIPTPAYVIGRVWQYAQSILYRATVVPLQIATWHFRYVAEYGSPGIYALPFARRLFGRSVDVPNQVHNAYYSIFSEGSRVSTGTTPTSFVVAYAAYFGGFGILMTVCVILVFDLLAAWVLAHIDENLRPVGIGLIVVACSNFMLSDFVTTLISHGAGAMLLLLATLAYIAKWERDTCARGCQ